MTLNLVDWVGFTNPGRTRLMAFLGVPDWLVPPMPEQSTHSSLGEVKQLHEMLHHNTVKSEQSITLPTIRAAELSKITCSASAMEQSSRWMRVRDKVKVRWTKTVDTVHSTISLYKSKTLKSKSVFSNELQSAKPQLRSLSQAKCHKYLPAQPRGEHGKRHATANKERHRSLPPERRATANRERHQNDV
jgi:hypothetical protein